MDKAIKIFLRPFFLKALFFLSVPLFDVLSGSSLIYAKAPKSQDSSKSCTHASIKSQQNLFKMDNLNAHSIHHEKSRPMLKSVISKQLKPEEITYKIVAKTPHDSKAYTQGLTYFQNHLYESSGGLGQSDIRKVDLKTGQVVKRKTLPGYYFAEGLSLVNKRLIQLTLKKNKALIYDIDSLNELGQFPFPGDGWGLVELNNTLLISNGSSVLQRFDSHNYQLLDKKKITVFGIALEGINEMENVNGMLYANIWPTDCIAIIDPDKYHVVAWINMSNLYPEDERPHPSAVLNGIAYNPEQQLLYITGKNWPHVFHLKLDKYPKKF